MRTVFKLKVYTATVFGALFVMPQFAQAAETPDLAAQANQATSNFMELVSQAVKGNAAAQEALLRDYLANALLLLAVGVISYMVASAIGRFVGKIVSNKVDITLGKFLSKAVRNVLMIIVAMVVLEYNNVNVTAFAAVLAALGFAIGMALQGTLSNFAAGIMLLLFRPFKVDDYIVVAGTQGTVEEIDLFTTKLNSPDNRHLIVPNGEIFGNKLENYTRNPIRRVDVNVGTAYSADLDQTRQVLLDAVNSVADGTDGPESQVYLMGLGASSVDWQLRVWCHHKNYWNIREHLTAAAKVSLDHAGISIPFPQMDLHVDGRMVAKSATPASSELNVFPRTA
jgi:small conductance mechanosensitive channel